MDEWAGDDAATYGEDLEWRQLARGLTERVEQLLHGLDSRLDRVDHRGEPDPIDVTFNAMLRSQQRRPCVTPHRLEAEMRRTSATGSGLVTRRQPRRR